MTLTISGVVRERRRPRESSSRGLETAAPERRLCEDDPAPE